MSKPFDNDECRKIFDEHRLLSHAMQAGVAVAMTSDQSATPKHLRVGINVALSDIQGLALLLVEKGIITDVEYATAIRDAMKKEVARYERLLKERTGKSIKLGGWDDGKN